jgi:hypothetical protein
MKAAILYLLLICSWFVGSQPVFAGSHIQKADHSFISKQLKENDRFIDAEDQNDEDDLNKKVTSAAKWLLNFNCEFLICDINCSLSGFSPGSHSYSGRDIYIVQQVLRL